MCCDAGIHLDLPGCGKFGAANVQCLDDWVYVQECSVPVGIAAKCGTSCSSRTTREKGDIYMYLSHYNELGC